MNPERTRITITTHWAPTGSTTSPQTLSEHNAFVGSSSLWRITQRTPPELLAPAGDMERLKMAVLYGADAVYLAGTELRYAGLRRKL